MNRTTFLSRLERVRARVTALGGEIRRWEIGEPVSMETVRKIEEKYQISLPTDFAEMVTEAAGRVDISWGLRGIGERYPEFRDIFSGELNWDIDRYLDEKEYRSYQDFQDSTDLPDFHGKLTLFWVPNGDVQLFDLAYPGEKKPVVYINHDGEYGVPVRLAYSFEEYVDSLLKIGLVGSEIWQLQKFIQPELDDYIPSAQGALDPECPYALAWREVLGLL